MNAPAIPLAILASSILAGSIDAQTVIPTKYVADRFYAAPVTLQGDTLELIMDTGGGNVFVTKQALVRPVLASIGGAAFRQFKLTMDYVNQRVTFEKP